MPVARRSILLAASSTAAVIGAEVLLARPASASSPTTAATSPPSATGPEVRRSPNGWALSSAADNGGSVWTRPLVGTGSSVEIAIGDAELILFHVARRFHYEIDTLRPGDVVGFRKAKGLKGYQLNHASGSAIDIRPGHYPVGGKGGFFLPELEVVRDILADTEGLVRWGGDFPTPDEAHFELAAAPDDPRVRSLASRLRDWQVTAGAGAGVIRNPQDTRRRDKAVRLQRQQTR